jgi:hypothetical protein
MVARRYWRSVLAIGVITVFVGGLAAVASRSMQQTGGFAGVMVDYVLRFWDAFKFLVSASVLTAIITLVREHIVRKDAKLSTLREMNLRIDELYRSTKQIRRVIRARLIPPFDNVTSSYNIDAKFFCEQMDALSSAQLKVEQMRNEIGMRSDLFKEDIKKIIRKLLDYSKSYLRDDVEEYERDSVRPQQNSEVRVIDCKSCKSLADFSAIILQIKILLMT